MHRDFETKIPPPCSGSLKDPTDRYIENPPTHPKASLRRKGLGAGRIFNIKVSKSKTLPIQISLTLVETSGGTTSVGLWFRSLLHTIVCQENVDDEKHLKIPFGTYMLANKDPKPTDTNASRILDYIHLRDTYSLQGGHEILHLQTNRIITRNLVKPSPITHTIINQLHYIAYR